MLRMYWLSGWEAWGAVCCRNALPGWGRQDDDCETRIPCSPANMNRQLPAMHSTLGMPKAEVLAGHPTKNINPDIELTVLPVYLKDENIPELLDSA